MPCMSYDDDPGYNDRQWKKKTDMLARIACKALTELGMVDPENPVFFDNEVTEWWEAHKEADRKAQEERERKAREHRVRNQALAKLTAEEKKVLGVK